MKNRKSIIMLFLFAVCLMSMQAQEKINDTTACCNTKSCFECCRPDAFAPAGVMTDHVHPKGEFGIAYGFMFTNSHGNMSGTNSVSDNDIYYNKGYMMAPGNMQMQMHMLMPMYGITNRLTAMAMINYYVNKMDMHMMPAQNMMHMSDNTNMNNTNSSLGFGDTKFYLLYNLLGNCQHRLVAGAGISLPTGSISVKGPTVLSYEGVLPYSMQLGTGTYNLLPSLVYVGQSRYITFGAALNTNIKTGINSRNYCLGNEYSFSPWLAYKIHSWASLSVRAEYYRQEKITGYDAELNQLSGNDPSSNVSNYGAQQRISAFAGINVYAPAKCLKGIRLFIEYGLPIYQTMEGLQMPFKSSLSARLQCNF
ncbi:MAG TPA: hypothetical protein VNZ49_11240 [Bacteroidia bacterium]|jgi:hypothetical protein|nr:hypothetical protein [Bacteroidia bacterium]